MKIIQQRDTARQSRNRNSEYLPQRRKGGKVRRLRVKIIYKSCCPFPITLAPLRLGGRNSRLRVLSMPDYLRRPRKFLTIVIRRARRREDLSAKRPKDAKNSHRRAVRQPLRALHGEQNKLNVTHVPHKSLKYKLFFSIFLEDQP